MGKASRDKGGRGEREFAKLIGGVRVPLSGSQNGFKGDVKGLGITWEIKRRRSGFKQLYGWLEKESEQPDALAVRADRKDWIVCMKLDKFLELMKGEEE